MYIPTSHKNLTFLNVKEQMSFIYHDKMFRGSVVYVYSILYDTLCKGNIYIYV